MTRSIGSISTTNAPRGSADCRWSCARGVTVNPVDLLIASVALVYDLTFVTNNTADFQNIPGLRLDDWLTP